MYKPGERFGNTPWDGQSVELHATITEDCKVLEKRIAALPQGRYTSLALTALEEAHLWMGKAVRDAQNQREAQHKGGHTPEAPAPLTATESPAPSPESPAVIAQQGTP